MPKIAFVALLVALSLATFLAKTAAARAGGGESYNSGSSGGGGGSGGGGSGSSSSYDDGSSSGGGTKASPRTQAIIVVVIVAYLIMILTYRGNSGASPPPPITPDVAKAQMEGAVQVEARAKMLFPALQHAWGEGSVAPVRRWLSDATYQRFELQLELARRQGVRNVVENPEILAAPVYGFRELGRYRSIDVRIRATLVDYHVRLADNEMVDGSRTPSEFEEMWSFSRLIDTKAAAEGAQPNACPNCGAPLEDAGGTRCSHCAAVVNSGAYDWVLCEITQTSEWVNPAMGSAIEDTIRSLAAGRPALLDWLAPQEIEDRAAAVFVRLHASFHEGRLSDLAPFVTAELLAELEKRTAGDLGLFRLAMGGVELIELEPRDANMLAVVLVKFSGCLRAEQPASAARHFERKLVFSRSLHSKPSVSGLASLGCGNCGAPIESADQANCVYCKTRLDSPESAWILTEYRL